MTYATSNNGELPTTRIEAKNLGQTKYFTGKECHKGHIAYRYVASGLCSQCSSEKAKKAWSSGKRQIFKDRPAINRKWNSSDKGKEAKRKWLEKDPKRAWAVFATGTAKIRAALKGIAFELTSEYVRSITPDKCPVFGIEFQFIGNKKITPNAASLDRLDPSKGYVKGNVVVICLKANMIKNAYGSNDIFAVANWLKAQGY